MDNKVKVLFFDIETSHAIAAIFGLYDQDIPHTNIVKEWTILSIAWKWLGNNKKYSLKCEFKKDKFGNIQICDKKILEEFCKVLEEADVVVGHNIDKFDIKKIKARMVYHGLNPINKLITIDTLKIAKREFAFISNRLDYLAKYLGLEGKMSTPTGLWLNVLNGCEKSLTTMVKYNIQDVVVLENVYHKLKPYITSGPHLAAFYKDDIDRCPNCASTNLIKNGVRTNTTGTYQTYKCNSCGGRCRSKKYIQKHKKETTR